MRKKQNPQENSTFAINPVAPWRLTKVIPLKNYRLKVEFNDGAHGVVEMEARIKSKDSGIFAKLIDVKLFNQVYLEHRAVTWPGGIDLAPDAMHSEIVKNGKWVLK